MPWDRFKLKEKLLENFDENEFDEIQYKQWTTTDRSQLETISQSTEEFVETFITKLQVLSRHDFIAQEQSNYLRTEKLHLMKAKFWCWVTSQKTTHSLYRMPSKDTIGQIHKLPSTNMSITSTLKVWA